MKQNGTMQDMIESIMKMVDMSESNFKMGDVFRTNNCTNRAHGMVSIFRFLGIEYDCGTYMDGEALRVGYLFIDGVVLVKNGVINWKAYADAVTDEAHGWGSKVLGISDR